MNDAGEETPAPGLAARAFRRPLSTHGTAHHGFGHRLRALHSALARLWQCSAPLKQLFRADADPPRPLARWCAPGVRPFSRAPRRPARPAPAAPRRHQAAPASRNARHTGTGSHGSALPPAWRLRPRLRSQLKREPVAKGRLEGPARSGRVRARTHAWPLPPSSPSSQHLRAPPACSPRARRRKHGQRCSRTRCASKAVGRPAGVARRAPRAPRGRRLRQTHRQGGDATRHPSLCPFPCGAPTSEKGLSPCAAP